MSANIPRQTRAIGRLFTLRVAAAALLANGKIAGCDAASAKMFIAHAPHFIGAAQFAKRGRCEAVGIIQQSGAVKNKRVAAAVGNAAVAGYDRAAEVAAGKKFCRHRGNVFAYAGKARAQQSGAGRCFQKRMRQIIVVIVARGHFAQRGKAARRMFAAACFAGKTMQHVRKLHAYRRRPRQRRRAVNAADGDIAAAVAQAHYFPGIIGLALFAVFVKRVQARIVIQNPHRALRRYVSCQTPGVIVQQRSVNGDGARAAFVVSRADMRQQLVRARRGHNIQTQTRLAPAVDKCGKVRAISAGGHNDDIQRRRARILAKREQIAKQSVGSAPFNVNDDADNENQRRAPGIRLIRRGG